MQFKNDVAEVHLIDLTEATAGIPLCGDHARTRTPPVGWTLVDLRTPEGPDVWARDPADGSAAPTSRPARRRSADPAVFAFGRGAEAGVGAAELEANSPLLSRAFRVVPH